MAENCDQDGWCVACLRDWPLPSRASLPNSSSSWSVQIMSCSTYTRHSHGLVGFIQSELEARGRGWVQIDICILDQYKVSFPGWRVQHDVVWV